MTQYELYCYNRSRVEDPAGDSPAQLMVAERQWIDDVLSSRGPEDTPATLRDLQQRLAELIASEQETLPASARFVAKEMTLSQFRVLVQEFAVDGLTEAQTFYYVMPRLTLAAQMPMLRIIIDEFGAGNPRRAHTNLYVELLRELGMSTDLAAYEQRVCAECLGFVNLFYWLTLRADDPSYFAGAITYLETAIPVFFECYVQACDRLGIRHSDYYSEHQHIDQFHAIEGQRLLRAMDASATLDPGKAWTGAWLTSTVTATAFEAAVSKARCDVQQGVQEGVA